MCFFGHYGQTQLENTYICVVPIWYVGATLWSHPRMITMARFEVGFRGASGYCAYYTVEATRKEVAELKATKLWLRANADDRVIKTWVEFIWE